MVARLVKCSTCLGHPCHRRRKQGKGKGSTMENGSAMTVEREFTFDDEAIHHRQLNPVATVLSTATWLSRSVNCILTYPFLKPPRAYAYEVSQEWIDEQKRLHVPTEHAPYISTNDILTSWFLRRGDYDVGYMVMDMRDRPSAMDKTRITSKHAGNYVSFLPMKKDIYSDPSGIRSILKQNMKDTYTPRDTPPFCHCRTPPPPPPSCCC